MQTWIQLLMSKPRTLLDLQDSMMTKPVLYLIKNPEASWKKSYVKRIHRRIMLWLGRRSLRSLKRGVFMHTGKYYSRWLMNLKQDTKGWHLRKVKTVTLVNEPKEALSQKVMAMSQGIDEERGCVWTIPPIPLMEKTKIEPILQFS